MSEENVQALKILSRFAFGLFFLGGLLGAFGIYFLFTANESLSWASVEGSVVEAEVSTYVSPPTNSTGNTLNSRVQYYVSVQYTYDVAGSPYVSSRYSLGEGDRASRLYPERSLAELEAAERFPAGSPLTVYYDPESPSSAVLAAGWNWGTFVPLLLGLFFGGSGWFIYAIAKTAKVPSGQ